MTELHVGSGFIAEVRSDGSIAICHNDGGLHMASVSEAAMVREIQRLLAEQDNSEYERGRMAGITQVYDSELAKLAAQPQQERTELADYYGESMVDAWLLGMPEGEHSGAVHPLFVDGFKYGWQAALAQRRPGEPVGWIADWAYEHLVSGHHHPGPVQMWADPQDKTGLVPLFGAVLGPIQRRVSQRQPHAGTTRRD